MAPKDRAKSLIHSDIRSEKQAQWDYRELLPLMEGKGNRAKVKHILKEEAQHERTLKQIAKA